MRIVFIGPPGAGKGTQARRLSDYLEIPHLSTGELLRQATRLGTDVGKEASQYMHQGKLVPDALVVGIVEARTSELDCENGYLLDGFPRTIIQAESFDRLLQKRGRPLDVVIQLAANEKELVRRMVQRSTIEHRDDDAPETVQRRLEVFRLETQPLLDYYRKRSLLRTIDGMGSIDDVYERVKQCVDHEKSA